MRLVANAAMKLCSDFIFMLWVCCVVSLWQVNGLHVTVCGNTNVSDSSPWKSSSSASSLVKMAVFMLIQSDWNPDEMSAVNRTETELLNLMDELNASVSIEKAWFGTSRTGTKTFDQHLQVLPGKYQRAQMAKIFNGLTFKGRNENNCFAAQTNAIKAVQSINTTTSNLILFVGSEKVFFNGCSSMKKLGSALRIIDLWTAPNSGLNTHFGFLSIRNCSKEPENAIKNLYPICLKKSYESASSIARLNLDIKLKLLQWVQYTTDCIKLTNVCSRNYSTACTWITEKECAKKTDAVAYAAGFEKFEEVLEAQCTANEPCAVENCPYTTTVSNGTTTSELTSTSTYKESTSITEGAAVASTGSPSTSSTAEKKFTDRAPAKEVLYNDTSSTAEKKFTDKAPAKEVLYNDTTAENVTDLGHTTEIVSNEAIGQTANKKGKLASWIVPVCITVLVITIIAIVTLVVISKRNRKRKPTPQGENLGNFPGPERETTGKEVKSHKVATVDKVSEVEQSEPDIVSEKKPSSGHHSVPVGLESSLSDQKTVTSSAELKSETTLSSEKSTELSAFDEEDETTRSKETDASSGAAVDDETEPEELTNGDESYDSEGSEAAGSEAEDESDEEELEEEDEFEEEQSEDDFDEEEDE